MAITGAGSTYQAALSKVPRPKDGAQLKIKIFSPSQLYYEGDGVSLSAKNATGPFDILPGHTNFFCLLEPGEIRVNTGFQELQFPGAKGVMKVTSNQVTVFLGA